MIIACFIISCLALLAAVTAIVMVFVNKKDSGRKHKVLMDLIGTSCQTAADGAVEVADDHIHEAMKQSRDDWQAAIDTLSELIHSGFENYNGKIKNLESGLCPDYEKSLEAAKAVNDFSAGITAILGFDPVQSARSRRMNGGKEAD